jgi:ABC-2 type transport system ATP-binding protein
MAAMPVIHARGLSKRYGRAVAVEGLDLDVERGEIVGFLGPNGAGKTTTLRILAGLIRPSAGRAEILGRRVPGPGLRRVGTMIEEPSFYPYMSGRDNLRYAATLHGDVDGGRIDEVLRFTRMENAAGKRVRAYSQGMRQRLGLARALLHRPDVLLLDEPTNGLDPVGIAEIRENLRAVAREGVTVLISSHILSEIEKLVDRVVAIERGRLRFDGPLHELVERIDERTVTMRFEAADPEALLRTLRARELEPETLEGGDARVRLPQTEVPALLRELAAEVELLEARREGEDLEGAYLRLLREDGRPS